MVQLDHLPLGKLLNHFYVAIIGCYFQLRPVGATSPRRACFFMCTQHATRNTNTQHTNTQHTNTQTHKHTNTACNSYSTPAHLLF
jgi:hypothetical protein